EEDGFTVARLQTPGRNDLVTIVGNILAATPGETLRLGGEWVVNVKYGEQFRVDSCLSVLPATLTGIQKYLGSGMIRGIGPVLAKRLVEAFALETLDVIDGDADRLQEVEGIGPVRSGRIVAAWEEQKQIREVMVFLQGHGVSSTYAVKIYKRYGNQSVSVVKENPYRLAEDIRGIGFKTADKIARNLGIDPGSQIRAEAGLLYMLSQMVDEGHVYYPQDQLVEKTSKELEIDDEMLLTALEALKVRDQAVVEDMEGQRGVYLKPLHMAEVNAASGLKVLLASPKKPLSIDVEAAIEWAQKTTGVELAELQKEAIRKAIADKVVVITGGPGTGKTTVVNSIIRILEAKKLKILLASPTGRAAKRLSEATGREAKTLHRLMEYSPAEGGFKKDRENPLDGDVLVVDEASMVDILLMNRLLQAVPRHATLVLVGDVDQLPSVGPGSVLKDIIQSGVAATVTLTEIFRQARDSQIIVNAHRVNQGDFPLIRAPESGRSDFYFIEREEPEEALALVKELCARRIPKAFGFHPVQQVQVLTPMHRGTVGVASLNKELQELLNPSAAEVSGMGRTFRVNDKVMQTENNYDKEVFNGDIGAVAGFDLEKGEVTMTFDDRQVAYDQSELDELTLAYAISVHKSQGSEYPAVVLPLLTQHYMMLQRNLLYTAMTRAKKLLVIVGSRKALAIAVKNDKVERRFTGLVQRLARHVPA
ncbi:MAG: ATP-dependent RecD-like DNA helicase, partial [Chloroflexota bacterium]